MHGRSSWMENDILTPKMHSCFSWRIQLEMKIDQFEPLSFREQFTSASHAQMKCELQTSHTR